MALRPCLIVGVGGSGGKTLRFVRSQLLRYLRAHGVDEIPKAWQMLYIDVPTDQEGGGEESQDGLPSMLPEADYLGLVNQADIRYEVVDQAVVAANTTEAMVGWRPPNEEVSVPIYKGAGQYRTVGRMISVYALMQIREAIAGCVSSLTQGGVHSELASVSRKLGYQTNQLTGPEDTWVFVVTSLAGGTGSGVFLDVCDVLRSSANGAAWTDDSIGLIYTGEVFGELRPADRAGVNANSLACMSEIMAGYWRESPSRATTQMFEAAGLHPPSRSGPRYPFLVGASNEEGVVTGRQVDIYGVVGNALSSFLTSPNLQNGMSQYTTTNWNQKATANVFQSPLLRQTVHEQPFTALGVSRLSLGRDRFADYAIDRLSGATVEHLLEGHLADVDLQTTAPHEVVDRRAGELLQSFLRRTFLNERSEQHNDVIDAIRPPGQAARLQEIRSSVLAKLQGLDPMSGRDWEQTIFAQLRDQRARLMNLDGHLDGLEAQELKERAQHWSATATRRFMNVSADYLASQGLHVTEQLIALVREELATVVEELGVEAAAHYEHYVAVQRVIASELDGVGRKVRATHDQVEQAVSAGVECLRWGAEAEVRKHAAELLRDFASEFAKPFEAALSEARDQLQLQARNANPLRGPIVSSWPTSGSVPDAYGPRHNEFLLEPHATFSAVFSDVLALSTSASSESQALRRAMTCVITGEDIDAVDRQERSEADGVLSLDETLEQGVGAAQLLATMSQEWVPKAAALRSDTSPPSPARFEVNLDVEADIQTRAARFVNDPDSAIGRYVGESLAGYLEDDDAGAVERADRLETFKDRFRELVRNSAPLVNINASTRTLAHPQSQQFGGSVRTFSVIPFGDPESLTYQAVMDENNSLDLGIDPDTFQASDASSISVFSFLPAPMQPHVFSSVVEPILEDWRQCQGKLRAGQEDPVGAFWKLRRSRGLVDFTPLPGASRRAIARGWFIAKVLGLVTVEAGVYPRIAVWDIGGGDWAYLPEPLLGGPIRSVYDELPRVLESLPIALVSQGRTGPTDRPLASYERLLTWGTDPAYQAGGPEFVAIGDPMESWVLRGETEPGAPTPPESLAGSAHGSADERRDACLRTLTDASKAYNEMASRVTRINHQQPQEFYALSSIVELAADIQQVFGELTTAMSRVGGDTVPTAI